MTENEYAIAVVRELLSYEQRNGAVRLQEASVFVSSLSTRMQRAISTIASASAGFCESLTTLIRNLGGEPAPPCGRMLRDDPNYLELSVAWPRLIEQHEKLLGYYHASIEKLSEIPEASSLVSRIADEHQRELAVLRSLQPNNPTQPVGSPNG